jgi:hypothetical protein
VDYRASIRINLVVTKPQIAMFLIHLGLLPGSPPRLLRGETVLRIGLRHGSGLL